MAKNFIEMGQTIGFIATSDVLSGQAVAIESLVIIAHGDVKSGEEGVGHAQGVFELLKKTATEIAQGADVYLTGGEIGTDTSGVYAGKAWNAAASGTEAVWVALNFGSPAAVEEPAG
ncbi:DUF2190 family protein [Vibrio gangliei]|uniref:DUF2190 family protein n=1 Tax=Vibrio gangliei TaxID=2077090 RepID=UPI000D01D7D9|nr:capsid cement protein [Vibrio gangliei]